MRQLMLGLLLLVPLSAGCVTVRLNRELRFEPLTDAALDSLQPGSADLTEVLAALGAPLYVWQTRGDGLALAWGWYDQRSWSLSVSVPVTSNASANFDYDQADERLRGVVLFIDANDQLTGVRRGLLSIIEAGSRRLPPPVE